MPRSAREVGEALYQWALQSGVLQGSEPDPTVARRPLAAVIGAGPDVAPRFAEADRLLEKVEITGIAFDEPTHTVSVLTKGHIGPRLVKSLPTVSDGVAVDWIGSAYIDQSTPPKLLPTPGFPKRCYIHNERIACGSSVIAAPSMGAGTLGCLVRTADGQLCGLSNNHVTGGCNHMPVGMPILSPAPIDASPNGKAPVSIGRHRAFVPLLSGTPGQVVLQQFDAAVFNIVLDEAVTSMQGEACYDTPAVLASMVGDMRVKKVGRTSGLTSGKVIGEFLTPIQMPYSAPFFSATVYYSGIFGIVGDGPAFSEAGDSGSLVVSEDGTRAVGMVFGSMNNTVSLAIPIVALFQQLNVAIVSGYHT